MNKNNGQNQTLEELCEQINVPYHSLRKIFRRAEGLTLLEYWQLCRIQKAEQLLSTTDKYIYEVAYDLGFTSDGNFTNWFKKHKGVTPKEYRRQNHHP